jgi:hypothetical protein
MLYVPYAGGQWQQVIHAPAAVRPASTYGVSSVPGNNTMGTDVTLLAGASLTSDVYGVLVNFNNNFVIGAFRDAIANIRYDPAGGTSWSTLIPNLGCTAASGLLAVGRPIGGFSYYFPLFIKAGTSLGWQSSVNNATVGTVYANLRLFCRPKRIDAVRVGSRVEAIGITAGTSNGTTVTSGTTSDGTWTSLGTSANRNWWWQQAIFCNDDSMTNVGYFMDLSAGSAGGNKMLIEDQIASANSNDEAMTQLLNATYFDGEVAAGQTIWGRLQASGTADGGLSMAAYGLGG